MTKEERLIEIANQSVDRLGKIIELTEQLEQAQAEIERIRCSKVRWEKGYMEISTEKDRYRKAIDEVIFLANLDESVDRPLTTIAKIRNALYKALEGTDNV